jgi:hypothetical protein
MSGNTQEYSDSIHGELLPKPNSLAALSKKVKETMGGKLKLPTILEWQLWVEIAH